VKPALRHPLGVSTNTRRRRCDIKPTIANGRVNGARAPPARENLRVKWEPAPERARATAGYVGRAETFPSPDQLSHLKVSQMEISGLWRV
jgi:hypothetical protein